MNGSTPPATTTTTAMPTTTTTLPVTPGCTVTVPPAFPSPGTDPDTVPPTVRITAPDSNTSVSGTVCLRATATDNVAVTSVEFVAGSIKLGNAVRQPSGSWDLAVPTAQYPNGTYQVVSNAKDAAGNQAASPVIQLRVAN